MQQNIGDVTLQRASDAITQEVERRADRPLPEGFSESLQEPWKRERRFSEKPVFHAFCEQNKDNDHISRLIESARKSGADRITELDNAGRKGEGGYPPLRHLLRNMRKIIQANPGEALSDVGYAYLKLTADLYKATRGKVGLKVRSVDNGVAALTVRQVSAPAYFALSKPGNSPEVAPFVEASGTCMIVRTSDDKLLVQYRTSNNGQYAEMLGASIAGMFDALPDDSYTDRLAKRHLRVTAQGYEARVNDLPNIAEYTVGRIAPVTIESMLHRVETEGKEELNLRANLTGGTFLGIAENLRKPHSELVFMGDVSRTSHDIVRKAKENYDANPDAHEVPEWCVAIPATPEAIEVMLADTATPLPPTHMAAFLATGVELVKEREGEAKSVVWFERVSDKIRDNLQTIDSLCREVTGEGYNPNIPTSTQGLEAPIETLKHSLKSHGIELIAAT